LGGGLRAAIGMPDGRRECRDQEARDDAGRGRPSAPRMSASVMTSANTCRLRRPARAPSELAGALEHRHVHRVRDRQHHHDQHNQPQHQELALGKSSTVPAVEVVELFPSSSSARPAGLKVVRRALVRDAFSIGCRRKAGRPQTVPAGAVLSSSWRAASGTGRRAQS